VEKINSSGLTYLLMRIKCKSNPYFLVSKKMDLKNLIKKSPP